MRARSKSSFLVAPFAFPRSSSVVDIKYEGSTRTPHAPAHPPGGGADAVANRRQTESHDGRFIHQPSDVVPVSPNNGAAGLDWDQDESMTEEWSASKHPAPRPSEIRTMLGPGFPQAVQPKRYGSSPDARAQNFVAARRSEPILPAARVPDIEDDVEQLRERLIDALERARTSEGRAAQAERRVKEAESRAQSTLEPLRARLIEALERAQIGEARAAQAERRAHEIESHAPVLAPANARPTPNNEAAPQLEPLQEQLVEALERARNSEARAAVAESAERHAQSLHATARDALERLTDELVEAMELARNNEAVALEAEQRAQTAERASYNVQAHWQHTEDQTTRVRERSSRLNLIWASIAVASVVIAGAGSYFLVYRPLNQRLAAAQALQRSESDRQAQELTNLKTASEAQQQRFATERAGLESQLTAARAAPVAPAPSPEKGKRGNAREGSMDAASAAPHRWHRKSSDDDADDATPKHAAHERAPKPEKPEKPAKADRDDSQKPAKPEAKSSGGGDDPLDGL